MLITLGGPFLKVLVVISGIVFRFILICCSVGGGARHRTLAQKWTLLSPAAHDVLKLPAKSGTSQTIHVEINGVVPVG